MSSSKSALKEINESIKQRNYDDAIDKAETLLKKDPKNYQW